MLYALGVSTIFIAIISVIAVVARKLVQRFQPAGLIQDLLYEGIASAELCAACFELIIIADNFGVATYAIYLFVLTIWWSKVWGDASACPYIHMEDMIEGNTPPRDVALKSWAQLMGGCCVYRLVQFVWWTEISPTYEGRAFEDCTADLQISPYMGAIVEGIATLLCRLASKTIAELNPKYATVIDSFIGTSLVVAAFNYSGGYFNPVLATALKWGCSGHTNFEHIIVYWIGACTGAVLSVPIFKINAVHNLLVGDVKQDKEKKEL